MSETKFTKGPWVSIKRRYDSSLAVETENTGFSICTTVSNEEIDEHNAHLIATAPEMYEMLEKYVELVIDDRAEDFIFEFREIKALLLKARGEV